MKKEDSQRQEEAFIYISDSFQHMAHQGDGHVPGLKEATRLLLVVVYFLFSF